MEEGLIKITPNKAKAKSILNMAKTTLEMVKKIDEKRFASNVIKEYYDVIRQLISAILTLDGYKTYGEGAHKKAIDYIDKNYKGFSALEISVMDELRITRNKIAYNGFFVREEYLERKIKIISNMISKLANIIETRL